jgi:hypothetical protein
MLASHLWVDAKGLAHVFQADLQGRRCNRYVIELWSKHGIAPNVLVSGRPLRWLIVARCFRPVRSTCSWATDFAGALVRRAEKVRAEAKRWRNEVRPVRADNRAAAPAEATAFELSLLLERTEAVAEAEQRCRAAETEARKKHCVAKRIAFIRRRANVESCRAAVMAADKPRWTKPQHRRRLWGL